MKNSVIYFFYYLVADAFDRNATVKTMFKHVNNIDITNFVSMASSSKQKSKSGEQFEKLGLNEWLWSQCHTMGLRQPTRIHVNGIPPILEGNLSVIFELPQTFFMIESYFLRSYSTP